MRWGLPILLALSACSTSRERPDGGLTSGIHPDDFHHPDLVADLGWDLNVCADCHGEDFAGGGAAVSCRAAGCHTEPEGPTACSTCHEAVPTTGAHTAHLELPIADCQTCHVVPATWDAPGHVLGDEGPPVDVVMGGLAAATWRPEDREGPPVWEHETGTCANVYCHGDALGDPAAAIPEPAWHGGASQAACGTCHGRPPADHAPVAKTSCAACHPGTAAHLDGEVDVRRGCGDCHGSDVNPAPPVDLAGNQFTTALGVGAHQSHLQAANAISAPVPCGACHLVPDDVTSPGHIDTIGPAEVILAQGDWDRVTATCSGTYCHGNAEPEWTRVDLGEVACGSCHGVPPPSAPHDVSMTVNQCVSCHPSTVDGSGNILVDGPAGDESEHLDGDIDL